jgi:hypothetical protein
MKRVAAFFAVILSSIASVAAASACVDANGNALPDSEGGASGDQEAELAKQLQNPVASLISGGAGDHLKPAISLALSDNWYAYTEFEETWGFEAHGEFSSTPKFEIGRGFGARGEWVLSARCELPITTSSDDYTVTIGCTYVFK